MAINLGSTSYLAFSLSVITVNNGDIYVFAGHQHGVQIYKSINDGASFTNIIGYADMYMLGLSANGMAGIVGVLGGDGYIHFAAQTSNLASEIDVGYKKWNASTETWEPQSPNQFEQIATLSKIGYDDNNIDIALDSNNVPHVLYRSLYASMGDDYTHIYYTNKITGSWSTPQQVEVSSSLYFGQNIVIKSDDSIEVIFGDINNNQVIRRTRTPGSGGTWGNATTWTNSATAGNLNSLLVSGSTVYGYGAYLNSPYTAYENDSAIGSIDVSGGYTAKLTTALVDGVRYVLYVDYTDGYIKYVKNSGTGWSTPETLETSGDVYALSCEWAPSNEYQSGRINYAWTTLTNNDVYYNYISLGPSTPLIVVSDSVSVGSNSTKLNLFRANVTDPIFLTSGEVGYVSWPETQEIDYETGDLSQWDNLGPSSGSPGDVSFGSALAGTTYGSEIYIGGGTASWHQKNLSSGPGIRRLGFWLDPNGATYDVADVSYFVRLYAPTTTTFRLGLGEVAGSQVLRLSFASDTTNVAATVCQLSDEPHSIELRLAITDPNLGHSYLDSTIDVWVDGINRLSIRENIADRIQSISRLDVGRVTIVTPLTGSFVYLDEISYNNTDTPIFAHQGEVDCSDAIATNDDISVQLAGAGPQTWSINKSEAISIGDAPANRGGDCGILASDSITVGETRSVQPSTQMIVLDSISLDESRFLDIAIFRSDTDPIAIGEIPIGALVSAPTQSTSDAVSVGDNVGVSTFAIITPAVDSSDNLIVSDQPRFYPDQIVVGESVSMFLEQIVPNIGVTEPVTVDENVLASRSISQISKSDSITVGETRLISSSSLDASVNDPLIVTDSDGVLFQPIPAIARSTSDSISALDNILVFISSARLMIDDQSTIAESRSIVLSSGQISVADIVSVSDIRTLKNSDLSIGVSDAVSVGENFICELEQVASIQRQVADTVIADDVPSWYSDSILVWDSVVGVVLSISDWNISALDNIGLGESVQARGATLGITKSDAISVGDTASVLRSVSQIDRSDSAPIGESSSLKMGDCQRSMVDGISPADNTIVSLAVIASFACSTSDAISSNDNNLVSIAFTRSISTDQVTIAENISVVISSGQISTADIVSVGETRTLNISDLSILTPDSVNAGDQVQARSSAVSISASDSIVVGDSGLGNLGTAPDLHCTTSDAISVDESRSVAVGVPSISTSDAGAVGDTVGIALGDALPLATAVADAVGVGDTPMGKASITLLVQDPLTILDVVKAGLPIGIFVQEGQIPGENLQILTLDTRSEITDSLTVADSLSVRVVINGNAFSNVILTDASVVNPLVDILFVSEDLQVAETNQVSLVAAGSISRESTDALIVEETVAVNTTLPGISTEDFLEVGTWGQASLSNPNRIVTDAVSTSDNVMLQASSGAFGVDTIPVQDSCMVGVGSLSIEKSDNVSISDLAITVLITEAKTTDAVYVNDVPIVELQSGTVQVTSTIPQSESISVLLGNFSLLVQDNLSVSDNLVAISITPSGINVTQESLSITDVIQVVGQGSSIQVVDAIPQLDSMTVQNASPRIARTDLVTVGDNANASVSTLRITVNSPVTVSDSAQVTLVSAGQQVIQVTDNIPSGDTASARISQIGISISDAQAVVDNCNVMRVSAGAISINTTDSVVAGDLPLGVVSQTQIVLSQSVIVLDSPIVVLGTVGILSVNTTDPIPYIDQVLVRVPDRILTSSDAVSVSDRATVIPVIGISAVDTLAVTDSLAVNDQICHSSVNESVLIADLPMVYLVSAGDYSLTVAESLAVEESSLVSIANAEDFLIASQDNVTVTDLSLAELQGYGESTFSDSIAVNDVVSMAVVGPSWHAIHRRTLSIKRKIAVTCER